ncbi:uncharacterized protein I303_104722 [Kwoniella dejecticola CBS 10117]|uniref:HhH-GPD domain-containing protein n=1 Tax=Kwoniella dejecticola CBS 10117 TaxID=1296121 RepID=A0A1A6A4I7_9TREE|nr:uncharacterized protein I303_04298 [Kwoniella dejecticola CBS 10117]OBR84972.1 hypothetical protein I303_04298 [Kwoniella dejecticola CBS 10117]
MPPRTRAVSATVATKLSTPIKTKAAAGDVTLPAKRKKANPIVASPLPPPQSGLLPPTLSFSLADAISHLSKVDPRFVLFFTHLPCRPFVQLEAIDPFRTLVTSIIGQQVSWLAARAINNRFRALYGFDPESKEGFPTAQVVSKEDVLRLKSVGLSTRKAEYVISLAQHFTSGQLSNELLRYGSDEEISKALIAVRGIGQWTVDMFLMFSLRRPDVLAVGDLGVQKGLLRWALAAHNALPKKPKNTTPKKGKGKANVIERSQEGELDTKARSTTPDRKDTPTFPPTPSTPSNVQPHTAALQTPDNNPMLPQIPPTPNSPVPPGETMQIPANTLPPPAPEAMLEPLTGHVDWDPHTAVPLPEDLTVEVLKSRLSGKKVKGGMYLTPKEMEDLTQGWRPYRSLAVFYMWPAAEEE